MHRQLFKVLLADKRKGFLLHLPRGLQKALGEEDFALLDQAPQRVVPDVMTARHLLGLLHHRQRISQLAFAVQHFAMHRRGDNPAVVVSQRQFVERHHRQAFCFHRIAIVNRHLGAQGVEVAVQRGIHLGRHLLLGARPGGD